MTGGDTLYPREKSDVDGDFVFPESGWKKVVDHTADSLGVKFSVFDMMDYFMCHKMSDGLGAENLRAVSSHSFGLYEKKYCRDGEACILNDRLYLKFFCKAEMKTNQR